MAEDQNKELVKILSELIDCQNKLTNNLNKVTELINNNSSNNSSDKKGKDAWDKISAISTFMSSVVLAGIGLYATSIYNWQQSKNNQNLEEEKNHIAEVDLVQKFLPSLTKGSEQEKKLTLEAIYSLTSPESTASQKSASKPLAISLAELTGTKGAKSALISIAENANSDFDKKSAQEALQKIGIRGIDVYEGSGKVDWQKVVNNGMEFAFVRATEGTMVVDSAFSTNWAQIKKAGIVRGAYHFFHPRTSSPIAQARHFMQTVKKFEVGDLPPVLDVEVTDGADASTTIRSMKLWLTEVEKELQARTGKRIKPIIYTFPNFWTETLGNPSDFADYPLWIVNFGVDTPYVPNAWKTWTFWQYAGDVNVVGVEQRADINKFNGSLDELKNLEIRK